MTLPDDQDRFNGVRATAERAWRMMDRSNWISKTVGARTAKKSKATSSSSRRKK